MAQLEEVSVDQFKHLVSERALDRRDHVVEHGAAASLHAWCAAPAARARWRDGRQLHSRYRVSAHGHREEHGSQDLSQSRSDERPPRLHEQHGQQPGVLHGGGKTGGSGCTRPRAQAIRVILTELERINSHLVWIGTFGLDLAAMSMFLYAFPRTRNDPGY